VGCLDGCESNGCVPIRLSQVEAPLSTACLYLWDISSNSDRQTKPVLFDTLRCIVSLLITIYRLLTHLYPPSFQEDFGAEMAAVFQEQMAEAAAQGRIHLLQTCWRELRDWPLHCIQVHWLIRQERLALATAMPPSWWETVMAGFPYFFFALIVTSSALLFLFGQATGLFVSLLFSYGFIFLLLSVLIAAWWRGWPVWSAAWLGFLFFIFLVLFLPGQLFNFLDQPAQMLVSEVGLPLLWMAVLYVLLTRWPRSGLVAMLPTFGITWLLYLEFVQESVSLVVMAVTWVWLGIVAIVLLRWRHHDWDVWLLYLAAMTTGVIYIFVGHFLTEVPLGDGTFAGMGEDLLSELIPVLIPLAGILLLHTLRWLSQMNGRTVVIGYRLMLAGVLLTFIGLNTRLMMSRQLNFSWPGNLAFWFTAVLLLGCLLLVVSVGLLAKNRKQWSIASGWLFWLLIILLLLLPLLTNVRWLGIAYGYGQMWLISRLMSIFWLVAAAWLIGTFRPQLLQYIPDEDKSRTSAAVQTAGTIISEKMGNRTRRQMIVLILALFLLALLLLPTTTMATLFPNKQVQPFGLQTSFPLFLLMTTGLMMMAVLLSSGFKLLHTRARRPAVFFFILSALLLAVALRNYYWLAIWDSTYDGLGFLWLFIPIMGVFLATIGLVVTLPRGAKLTALFYLLLLPPALLLVTERTYHVNFYQLTEIRAERVNQAIKAYYIQANHYPDNLQQLTPRHLRSLSEPMIIFGQDWCYDSEGDQYQFGYVYREHWSSPILLGYAYSAPNEESGLPPLCEAEIAGLRARDPEYYSSQYR